MRGTVDLFEMLLIHLNLYILQMGVLTNEKEGTEEIFPDEIDDKHIWLSQKGIYFSCSSIVKFQCGTNMEIEVITLKELKISAPEDILRSGCDSAIGRKFLYVHMIRECVNRRDSGLDNHSHLLQDKVTLSEKQFNSDKIISPKFDEKPKCNEYDKGFQQNSGLYCQKYSLVARKCVRCENCDLRFTLEKGLLLHKALRCSGKPYNCDICSQKFARMSHLIKHKLIHKFDAKENRKEE